MQKRSSRSGRRGAWLGAVAALLLAPGAGASTLLDFEGLAHGSVVDDAYANLGVTIVVENDHKDFGPADDGGGDDPDWGVVFDTAVNGTADPDLEDPLLGNLPEGTVLGKVLVIQENFDGGCNGGTLCDNPDDEGGRPAGRFIFDFAFGITSFGLDVVDIDSLAAENGSVDFYQSGVLAGSLSFDSIAGLILGDNRANRIDPIDAEDLGLPAGETFDRVVVEWGGSGAIDNVVFTPEPASAALLALGLLGLAGLRRR